MFAEVNQESPLEHFGFNATLKYLSVTSETLSIVVSIEINPGLTTQQFSFLIRSGNRDWSFVATPTASSHVVEGSVVIQDLALDVFCIFRIGNQEFVWTTLKLHPLLPNDLWQWKNS